MPVLGHARGVANRILGAIPAECFARLRPQLQPMTLERRQVMHRAGDPATSIYFVERGLISLIKTMQDGRSVEVGAVGAEGFTASMALLGIDGGPLDAVVQIPGIALRADVATVRAEMARSAVLHDLVGRYVRFSMLELAQTAACNRLHSLEERCCRWLLIAHDSAGGDSFPLTHEFLALMLGVRRAGVSVTAAALQRAGLIEYRRGRVTVRDRAALEAACCECYAETREQLFAAIPLVPHA